MGFFSLSVAGGGLITLASYNPFKNNVIRDTMIVCFGNCLTSFVAGFAIFSVLGFMAKELNAPIEEIATPGTGLAFVAYPDLVTRFPAAPFWSFLFFAMLFTLGLDSQFAIVETILSGILDFKPNLRSKKTIVIGIICVIGFFCGLPLTQQGGPYLLDLLDYYAAGWPYLFIGFTELIIIGHVYGIANVVGMAIALIAILAVPFMAVVQFCLGLLEAYRNPEFNFVKDAPIVLYNLTQPTEEWRTNALESEGLKPNHNQNGNGELGYDNQAAETRDTKF